jgi:hypothetical protein
MLIDALQHDEADIPSLVGLNAKLSSMRALSSRPALNRAEDVVRKAGQELRRNARNGHRWYDRFVAGPQRRVPRRIRGNAANTILSFTRRR